MSDANYQMLVEIGGIMDGAVPREGICTTADGVRWLCDRVQELKNELYETNRERDEAREQNAKLRDIAERAIELALAYYDGPCERDGAKLRLELDQLKEGGK